MILDNDYKKSFSLVDKIFVQNKKKYLSLYEFSTRFLSKMICGTDHKKKFFPNWVPLEVFNKLLFQNAFGQWSHGKGFPQFQVKSHYESSTRSSYKMIFDNNHKENIFPQFQIKSHYES